MYSLDENTDYLTVSITEKTEVQKVFGQCFQAHGGILQVLLCRARSRT